MYHRIPIYNSLFLIVVQTALSFSAMLWVGACVVGVMSCFAFCFLSLTRTILTLLTSHLKSYNTHPRSGFPITFSKRNELPPKSFCDPCVAYRHSLPTSSPLYIPHYQVSICYTRRRIPSTLPCQCKLTDCWLAASRYWRWLWLPSTPSRG